MDQQVALDRRRQLRVTSTIAGAALWRALRGRRLRGFKFRRQVPVGPFILDFYCPEARLALEVDGGQHFEDDAIAYDQRRSEYLASRGIEVIRFTNDQVFREPDALLNQLFRVLGPRPPPRPPAASPALAKAA